MGECIAVSGIGKDAFEMIDTWLGFLPGGIMCRTGPSHHSRNVKTRL
jgi:hypothetical protein